MALRIPLNFQPSEVCTEEGTSQGTASIENSPMCRLSNDFQPSCVILLKGAPADLREIELLPFLQHYAPIKDILIAHHKRYAFIQFDKVETAVKWHETHREKPAQIRGNELYVFFTGKDTISKPKALLHPASRYIRMKLSIMDGEITKEIVLNLLAPFGNCLKIVIKKKKKWEVIAEMEDVFQAILAREYIATHSNMMSQMRVTFSDEVEMAKLENEEYIKEEGKDNSSNSSGGNSPYNQEKWGFDDLSPTFSMLTYPVFQQRQQAPQIMNFSQKMIVIDQFKELNNILIVDNLPENISPLMLFRLFGTYGNVLKVKILFNKPEKSFIEFQSPYQAELARANLNNCPLLGKNISVDFAKPGTVVDVSLLKKDPQNKYMGDYTTSSEHRYKYVAPPSKVLHLSNLPQDKDEEFYKQLFLPVGKVEKFIFMKNTDNMALVEMENVGEAILILTMFHNYDIEGKFLKVSFSKYTKVKQERL